MSDDCKALLPISKAADYLGVSVATVRRMVESGELIPAKTPGGHSRFSITELKNYLGRSTEYRSNLNPSKYRVLQTKLDSDNLVDVNDSQVSEVNKGDCEKTMCDPRNSLNDLSGTEWLPETKSYLFQKGLGSNHPNAQIEKMHPAPFSYQDISHLVLFFTKKGGKVLDPFGGVGSTAKACAVNGRFCTQIELTKKWHELAIQRLEKEVGSGSSVNHNFILGDCVQMLPTIDDDIFDLMVTSPPYWGILNKKPDHKVMERVKNNLDLNYSDDELDLGNIPDYSKFVDVLVNRVFIQCGRVLKPKKYMCIVVSDFRDKSKFVSFHSDLIRALDGALISEKYELALQGTKILLQNHKSLKPYGYPFAYVENIHHQYILIFRKVPRKC